MNDLEHRVQSDEMKWKSMRQGNLCIPFFKLFRMCQPHWTTDPVPLLFQTGSVIGGWNDSWYNPNNNPSLNDNNRSYTPQGPVRKSRYARATWFLNITSTDKGNMNERPGSSCSKVGYFHSADKSLPIGFILPKPIEYDLSNGECCLLFEQLWPDGQGPRLFSSPIPAFHVCRTGVT